MGTEPIRLTVELTYEDYAEAARAVQAIQGERAGAKARRSPSWALIVAIALGVGLSVFSIVNVDPTPGIRPPFYTLITLLLPPVVLLSAIVTFSVMQRSAARIRSRSGGSTGRFVLAVVGWTVTILLLLALYIILSGAADRSLAPLGAPGATAESPDWYGTMAPHGVWLLLTAVLLVALTRLQAKQLRTLWDGQSRLRRPNHVLIDADGIGFDDHVSRRRYQWLAFTRFVETANLLLLCPSDVTFEILPKRAFPSPEALAAARALFEAQIIDPDKLSYAFPIGQTRPIAAAAGGADVQAQ